MFKLLMILVFTLSLGLGTGLFAEEDEAVVERLMLERVAANEAYKISYTADAENEVQAKNEAAYGEQWVVYNKLVMTEGSLRMQGEFLKLEYLGEINTAQYDYDYGEGIADKAAALVKMKTYKAKPKEVQDILDRLAPPSPQAPDAVETPAESETPVEGQVPEDD